MKASYFISLVQNIHNESDVQPALPGVVPGIVCIAPTSTITNPRTWHNTHSKTQSKTQTVRKEKKLTSLSVSPKYPAFLYFFLAVCVPRNG